MFASPSLTSCARGEGHALLGAMASGARGDRGRMEQGMPSRDRREPRRPCRLRERGSRPQARERPATVGRESERLVVPRKAGNRVSSGPAGGKVPPEQEDR